MSILITGVTGTLGTILAEYFLKKKRKFLGVLKKSHHTKEKNLKALTQTTNYSFTTLSIFEKKQKLRIGIKM